MGEKTNIAWTDHTFNPWWGCVKVSPACDHCYAESWAKRTGLSNLWGVDSARRFFSAKHWTEPIKWNRNAHKMEHRPRVFCASMADVFDNHPAVASARADLWDLIEDTPNLDWLLLTKRVGNVQKMVPRHWSVLPRNVWLGISVVNQVEADRDIPKLLEVAAHVRFLSCEPLLGPIDLEQLIYGIKWIIVGGESGSRARPMEFSWARSLLGDARSNDVAFFMKQLSEDGDPRFFKEFWSFPEDLQVREWPKP